MYYYNNCKLQCNLSLSLLLALYFSCFIQSTLSTPQLDNGSANATSRASPKLQLSTRPIILVVSFDGFRQSYLDSTRTPILTRLSSTGSTVPYLIPTFPTKTFVNHQSIATGLYADVHGIVDNSFYDPLYKATLDGKKNGTGFWNYDPRVIPLWIYNEQQGGISGCVMWPGSNHGYGAKSNLLPTYYSPRYDQTQSWESRVNTAISWMTNKQKPANLVYLYYHQPDGAGHSFGPNGKETLKQVEETDKRVGLLINKLKEKGIYDRINLVLLSDHGMAEVTKSIGLPLDFTKLVKDVNGISPVLQIVPKSGKSVELYDVLRKQSRNKNFSVFKKSEVCGEPYFYCNSRRIHDFVTLADPGWAFKQRSTRKKRANSVYGSHGYVNTDESMRAIFVAKGPAFKESYKTKNPIKNVDVVPLFGKILGLSKVPYNGSLSRIEGMLKK